MEVNPFLGARWTASARTARLPTGGDRSQGRGGASRGVRADPRDRPRRTRPRWSRGFGRSRAPTRAQRTRTRQPRAGAPKQTCGWSPASSSALSERTAGRRTRAFRAASCPRPGLEKPSANQVALPALSWTLESLGNPCGGRGGGDADCRLLAKSR